jgi:hypothetical protein
MRIHHFSIPAHNPQRVADVLAGLLGARVIALPHPRDTLLVYAGDSDGSAIEIWPAATRVAVGGGELERCDELPLPERWPHHAYLTTDACDAEQILAAFAREGWSAHKVHNGPPHAGFSLVRGLIENHTPIELGTSAMRAEYERFFRELVARQEPNAPRAPEAGR